MPYLKRLRSDDEMVVSLGQELTVIGRSDSCDLKLLGHSEISREHSVLHHYEDGTVTVTDLGSKNGTWVNGRRIAEETKLRDGDLVRLSRKVEFRYTEMEPEPTTDALSMPTEEMTILEESPRPPAARPERPPAEQLADAASEVEKKLESEGFGSLMAKFAKQASARPKKKPEQDADGYW